MRRLPIGSLFYYLIDLEGLRNINEKTFKVCKGWKNVEELNVDKTKMALRILKNI